MRPFVYHRAPKTLQMTAFLATENCFQLALLSFGSGFANVETSLAST